MEDLCMASLWSCSHVFYLSHLIMEMLRFRKLFKLLFLSLLFQNLKRASGSVLQEYHLFLLSFFSTKDDIASHESIVLSERMCYKMLISDRPPMLLCNCISKPNMQHRNYFTKKNISSSNYYFVSIKRKRHTTFVLRIFLLLLFCKFL